MDKVEQIIQGIKQETITQETIKITRVSCSIDDSLKLFGGVGNKMIENYMFDKANNSQIKDLLLYFTGSDQTKLDLKKGIMLTGNVGTGKTMIMKIIRYINSNIFKANSFKIVSSRDMVKNYQLEGYAGISQYITKGVMGSHPRICIDDIGAGIEMVNYFGTQSNIIAEILLERYEIFTKYHILTHVTTNLNAEEIETKYGDRVRSRMREMFNMIQLTGDDRRK